MKSPRHLWTGDWRLESERARQAAEEEAARRRAAWAAAHPDQPEEPDASKPRTVALRSVAAVAVGVLALAAGAYAAGALLGGGGDDAKPLPAVSSTPMQPRKGQTRAGAIYAKASPAVVSIRTSAGSRHRLPLRQRRHARHQRPRRRQLASSVAVRFGARRPQHRRRGPRHRPVQRPRGRRTSTRGDAPGNVKPLQFADSRGVQRRRRRDRDRQPVRPRPHRDRGHRLRPRPPRSRRPTASRSTRSSRPTRRSTPATPAARCSTTRAPRDRRQLADRDRRRRTGNGNVGIGFAVPSNTVRQVVPRLKQGQTIARPYLGVRRPRRDGARRAQRRRGRVGGHRRPGRRAPACSSGDVITEIDGQQVNDPDRRRPRHRQHAQAAATTIDVDVERSGQRAVTLDVTLGNRPDQQRP